MFRILQVAALVVCSLGPWAVVQGGNTYFWLSTQGFPSASSLPGSGPEVPEFYNFKNQGTGSFYIWGRPDGTKSLKNWSLNLVCNNPNILTFDSAQIYNLAETNVRRWEYTSTPIVSTTSISNIAGFSLSSTVGKGIGTSTAATDQYFDPVRNAWLIAKVNYSLQPFGGYATGNLSLQVSSFGVSSFNELISQASVVFGHNGDSMISPSIESHQNANIGLHDGVLKYFDKPDADFDGDTDVDGRDFLIWQRNFGTLVGATNAMGNANPGPIEVPGKDGQVNKIDLAAWQFQYGTTGLPLLVSSLQVVPEPSAMLLAFWAVSAMLTSRRQRYASKVSNSRLSPSTPPSRQIQPLASHVTGGGES